MVRELLKDLIDVPVCIYYNNTDLSVNSREDFMVICRAMPVGSPESRVSGDWFAGVGSRSVAAGHARRFLRPGFHLGEHRGYACEPDGIEPEQDPATQPAPG